MEELSEKEIIQKIKQGEIDYFAPLVQRFSHIIYYYTKKKMQNEQDVEDVVQNSFIKAYKSIDRFDVKKTFYPYLFTIVKNEIAEYYRKKKTNIKLTENAASYEQSFDEKDGFESLLKNVRKEYQVVLQLYYEEGYSYKEIADKLDKPVNTVKTLLFRAKEELKKHYEKK